MAIFTDLRCKRKTQKTKKETSKHQVDVEGSKKDQEIVINSEKKAQNNYFALAYQK